MKNQMDWIVTLVSFFLMIVLSLVFMFTKPTVVKPAPPATVNLAKLQMPAAAVQFANSLPGGGGGGGGGGGAGAPGSGMMGRGGMGPGGAPGNKKKGGFTG